MSRGVWWLLQAGGVCLGLASAAQAQTVTDDRVWFTLTLQERGNADTRWRWSEDVVVRSREGVSELDILNFRTTLLYALNTHSSVGGGYSFVPMFPATGGHVIEHRWFGQYLFTGRGAGGTVGYRARVEARFIEGNSGELTRLRQQLRFTHAVRAGSKVAVSVWDEFFVHLNNTTRNQRGVDHNRLFGGLSVTFSSRARFEGGYLNYYSPGHGGAADKMYHVLSTTLVLAL